MALTHLENTSNKRLKSLESSVCYKYLVLFGTASGGFHPSSLSPSLLASDWDDDNEVEVNRYEPSLGIVVDETPYVFNCGGGTLHRISQHRNKLMLSLQQQQQQQQQRENDGENQANHEPQQQQGNPCFSSSAPSTQSLPNPMRVWEWPNINRLLLTQLKPSYVGGLPSFIIAPWAQGRHDELEITGPVGTQQLVQDLLVAYEPGIADHRDGLAPVHHPLLVNARDVVVGNNNESGGWSNINIPLKWQHVYKDERVTIGAWPSVIAAGNATTVLSYHVAIGHNDCDRRHSNALDPSIIAESPSASASVGTSTSSTTPNTAIATSIWLVHLGTVLGTKQNMISAGLLQHRSVHDVLVVLPPPPQQQRQEQSSIASSSLDSSQFFLRQQQFINLAVQVQPHQLLILAMDPTLWLGLPPHDDNDIRKTELSTTITKTTTLGAAAGGGVAAAATTWKELMQRLHNAGYQGPDVTCGNDLDQWMLF